MFLCAVGIVTVFGTVALPGGVTWAGVDGTTGRCADDGVDDSPDVVGECDGDDDGKFWVELTAAG